MTIDDIKPWDRTAVSHLPKCEQKAAYFLWHQRTKAACKRLGVPMPVRIKRSKASSKDERIARVNEQCRAARAENVDKARLRLRVYYGDNREYLLEQKRLARIADPEKFAERSLKYRTTYPDRVIEKSRSPRTNELKAARHKVRNKTDLPYRMRRKLRSHLHWCIRAYGKGKGRKSASMIVLLGCSIEAFIAHIESLFLDGMSWDNYGLKGWHIDHRIPCATFDFSDGQQQMACFHYTNLQPLWARDNHRKGARLNWKSADISTSKKSPVAEQISESI